MGLGEKGLKRMMGSSLTGVGEVLKVLVDNQDEQIQLLKEIRDEVKLIRKNNVKEESLDEFHQG